MGHEHAHMSPDTKDKRVAVAIWANGILGSDRWRALRWQLGADSRRYTQLFGYGVTIYRICGAEDCTPPGRLEDDLWLREN